MFHLHRVSLCETPTAAVMLIEPLLWHVCCCLLESAGKCGLCEFYFPAKTDARLRLGCVSGSKYEKRKSRHFTKNTEFNVSGRLLVRRGIMNTRGFQENQHHGQSQSEEAFVPVTSVVFFSCRLIFDSFRWSWYQASVTLSEPPWSRWPSNWAACATHRRPAGGSAVSWLRSPGKYLRSRWFSYFLKTFVSPSSSGVADTQTHTQSDHGQWQDPHFWMEMCCGQIYVESNVLRHILTTKIYMLHRNDIW